MEEKTSRPFSELGWLVHYLGVIFTPSELPTSGTVSSPGGTPCRSLRRGLNAEARPPPPVSSPQSSKKCVTPDAMTGPLFLTFVVLAVPWPIGCIGCTSVYWLCYSSRPPPPAYCVRAPHE